MSQQPQHAVGGALTAAVVGTGYIARQHIAGLHRSRHAELAAVCDISPVMAEATAERYGVARWYTDYAKLLEEVRPRVVHVTTPVHTHFNLASQALAAGAHVLVEKPITDDAAQLEKLLALAASRQLHIVEDHNYLFERQIQRVLDLIEEGGFGDVVHVEVSICLDIFAMGSRFADRNAPHPALAQRGGAISDFLPHMAYLACAFAGPHRGIDAVWRRRCDDAPEGFDELRCLVEGKRATALLSFSASAQPDGFFVHVEGTKMRATANLFEPRLVLHRLRGGPRPLMPVTNQLVESAAVFRAAFGGLFKKLRGRTGSYEGLWALVDRFYAGLAQGGQPPVTPTQITQAAGLVEAILQTCPDEMCPDGMCPAANSVDRDQGGGG